MGFVAPLETVEGGIKKVKVEHFTPGQNLSSMLLQPVVHSLQETWG